MNDISAEKDVNGIDIKQEDTRYNTMDDDEILKHSEEIMDKYDDMFKELARGVK